MHRSRLCTIVIDCETETLSDAASFWSAAVGRKVKSPMNNQYVTLGTGQEDPIVVLQKVRHPSRVHLDIETDNVEREVARLEALGATRVEKVKDWWVIQAPTGHRFCVLPIQHESLPDDANEWA